MAREGRTRLYVGGLSSSRAEARYLESMFGKYGRVRDFEIRKYAFVEFSDPRDAEKARRDLDGKDVDGRRIIVEYTRAGPREPGEIREYDGKGKGPALDIESCSKCGLDGHRARDCKAGDGKNKSRNSPRKLTVRDVEKKQDHSSTESGEIREYDGKGKGHALDVEQCSGCGLDGHQSRDCKYKCYRCGERGHTERDCRKKRTGRGRSYSPSPVGSRSLRRSRSRSRNVSRSYRSPVRKRAR